MVVETIRQHVTLSHMASTMMMTIILPLYPLKKAQYTNYTEKEKGKKREREKKERERERERERSVHISHQMMTLLSNTLYVQRKKKILQIRKNNRV